MSTWAMSIGFSCILQVENKPTYTEIIEKQYNNEWACH